MNVKQVILELCKMPNDADVTHLWDGEARTNIDFVWLSRGGFVVTSGCEQTAYSDNTRPVNAPSQKEEPYWGTPENTTQTDFRGIQKLGVVFVVLGKWLIGSRTLAR